MASDPASPPEPDAARGLPLRCPAPARPRGLDAIIMVVLLGSPYLFMGVADAGSRLQRTAGAPSGLLGSLLTGCAAVLLAVVALLLYAHATRYRAAYISDEGIILGLLEPTPRGAWLRWSDLVGFRIGTGRVVLAVRGQPWTRWLGPIIDCDDELLHRVVVVLEARGLRRLDG